MLRLLALPLLLLATPALAQSADRLPPANPMPFADAEAEAVMAPINGIFGALAARDGSLILPHVLAEGRVTVAMEGADGTRRRVAHSWAEFAEGLAPGPERYEERLYRPAIEVDGDIAMVWAPYVFLIDGAPHHCGTNHFDLIRDGGAWKLLNVTYTHRTTGCAPE